MRKIEPVVAGMMDGLSEDIPVYFKTVYEGLYNSVNDG